MKSVDNIFNQLPSIMDSNFRVTWSCLIDFNETITPKALSNFSIPVRVQINYSYDHDLCFL